MSRENGGEILSVTKVPASSKEPGHALTRWRVYPTEGLPYFFRRLREFYAEVKGMNFPRSSVEKMMGIQVIYPASAGKRPTRDRTKNLDDLENFLIGLGEFPFINEGVAEEFCNMGFSTDDTKWVPGSGLLYVHSALDISKQLSVLISDTANESVTPEELVEHLKQLYTFKPYDSELRP